jgi:hypothetical protein
MCIAKFAERARLWCCCDFVIFSEEISPAMRTTNTRRDSLEAMSPLLNEFYFRKGMRLLHL